MKDEDLLAEVESAYRAGEERKESRLGQNKTKDYELLAEIESAYQAGESAGDQYSNDTTK